QHHRNRDPVARVERRTAADLLGIGSDQAVEVAGLELVGVLVEKGDIGHPVVGGTGAELIAEGEGGKRRVAAGASAGDDQAVAVHQAFTGQVYRCGPAVFDVEGPPVVLQQV